ncbi:TetR/AcrR family transcriptional regulator [Amycolatopsis sp. FDAARGOS 1241]|uniref:TetR/AcrR family transcriptional regulator n=1 Tax=Amycolatopsis sp. FDAARGOS 1241 TaxID=2778070 RepID=UPI00194EC53D|nr:TetR/AcrR family transcriptional regulator [Amycolatopsis sp. FDAARGOS 1241]QRP43191.1 TetR family transcriptional regulator [Amycolatopsis sp. FDAARGOS 1241]
MNRASPAVADRILVMAAALFRRKGYAAATTRELAELLNIQKATLYHHIGAKEDLLHGICRESLGDITRRVEQAAADVGGPERLEAMIEAHVESALEFRDLHSVMLFELRSLTGDRLTDVMGLRDTYERVLQDAVEHDQSRGLLRTDLSARRLTLALLNSLNWTIFWYDPAGDMSPREVARFLSSVFLDGAASPGARQARAARP